MHNPRPATVITETRGPVAIIIINRPEVRNAVDGRTADGLREAFEEFESAPDLPVAVLTGAEGTFCAGADLKAISTGAGNRIEADMSLPGPMGPTRMTLSKPTIAAVEGPRRRGRSGARRCSAISESLPATPSSVSTAVAGGPAHRWRHGSTLEDARPQPRTRSDPDRPRFPQLCMNADRRSSYEQWDLSFAEALANETAGGLEVVRSGETREGASRFAAGAGRHGSFDRSGPRAASPHAGEPSATMSASRASPIPETRVRSSTEVNGRSATMSAAREGPMWTMASSDLTEAVLMSTQSSTDLSSPASPSRERLGAAALSSAALPWSARR